MIESFPAWQKYPVVMVIPVLWIHVSLIQNTLCTYYECKRYVYTQVTAIFATPKKTQSKTYGLRLIPKESRGTISEHLTTKLYRVTSWNFYPYTRNTITAHRTILIVMWMHERKYQLRSFHFARIKSNYTAA